MQIAPVHAHYIRFHFICLTVDVNGIYRTRNGNAGNLTVISYERGGMAYAINNEIITNKLCFFRHNRKTLVVILPLLTNT